MLILNMARTSKSNENAIATAIRYAADKENYQSRARVQWASKLQDAGNLVLAGTVISQFLNIKSGEFNFEAAVSGLIIFFVTYILAFNFMKGGGSK